MCGIIGYIGNRQAYPVLIGGLQRLEYRGYDSSGIALLNGDIEVYKKNGKVFELENFIKQKNITGNIGIGHTRWATHGEASDINAHPHQSMSGLFSIVHNGIIENHARLKEELSECGFQFYSDTDTEVLVNLIEYFYSRGNKISGEMALELALSKITGTYGIALLCNNEKNSLIVARRDSPMAVGLGIREFFIASDAAAISDNATHMVYLKDNDIASLSKDHLSLKNIGKKR